MPAQTAKRRYSGKVRALGYGIILLELATVVVLSLAVFSNAAIAASIGSSLYTVRGNGFALQNVTRNGQVEHAFLIPKITNNAYLPVTVSINAAFLNSQGQTIGNPLSESLTIAPGQSQPLVLPTSLGSTSDINGIHVSFEISSIYGLVGGGMSATFSK
ncbi:MAG TPA: hypothetical protein VFE98_04550 [Candidatus Bathyarchaeia archaeon]|nr:hypothetical protein [Candidatus Bathyarchaeia archaeon]